MILATDQIRQSISPERSRSALLTGILAANGNPAARRSLSTARRTASEHRQTWGFSPSATPRILTAPAENLKLDKSVIPAYGITLSHFSFRSRAGATPTGRPRRFNFCPNAGHCTKVCVLDNGSGRYDSVQRGRGWKSDLLLHDPFSFFTLLGDEIRRAIRKHPDGILCRPNVNSDLQWELIAPALVDGSLFQDSVRFYGYTKLPEYLTGDGNVTPYYRLAYSWSERSPSWGNVLHFLGQGGSVAVVTDRKPHTPIRQWAPQSFLDGRIADADLTDEWISQPGTIGDLSAKGKARQLIGRSDFITLAYSAPTTSQVSLTASRKG